MNRSSQNLADADFPGALLDCIGGKTEQTQAGDKNRQESKNRDDSTQTLFGPVEAVKAFIQEKPGKRSILLKFPPLITDEGYGVRDIVRFYTNGEEDFFPFPETSEEYSLEKSRPSARGISYVFKKS